MTKVYFYSNNSESHYQSPSSLPVFSSVTKINTGSSSGHERGHAQDTQGARPASNKSKSSSITIMLSPELCFRHSLLVFLIAHERHIAYIYLYICKSVSSQVNQETKTLTLTLTFFRGIKEYCGGAGRLQKS